MRLADGSSCYLSPWTARRGLEPTRGVANYKQVRNVKCGRYGEDVRGDGFKWMGRSGATGGGGDLGVKEGAVEGGQVG